MMRSCVRHLAALVVFLLALPATAGEPLTLDLAGCLDLAREKQPALAAFQASLAAAENASKSLEALRIPTCLAHELPIRRHQATLGVQAHAAALTQAEAETVYAVTRSYYTVLYAREQEGVARRIVDRLQATHDVAARLLKDGAREVSASDVDRSTIYLELARARQIEASIGIQRALAALREAVGLDPDCCLNVPPIPLPVPTARPDRQEVIGLALARRGGLIQAGLFAELACLEVEAQASSHHLRLETFAFGGDVHALQTPGGSHDTEYRPAAIPPEMPVTLVGSRCNRTEHARALSARAAAVEEKTRNLVALSAEDYYLRWEEASRKAEHARKAAETGDKLAEALNKDFAGGAKLRPDEVLAAHVLAAQAREQYTEFLFQSIVALADLERVTAGGFCAGLVPLTSTMTGDR